MKGKFITLEGGEGAGKSTQAKKLAAYLKSQGIKSILTREVGGTPGGEDIRKLWLSPGEGYWDSLAELLLIFAARREHLAKVIWPALKRGEWVICDRFMDSTRAYQAKAGPIEKIYELIADQFEPHLTLLLDLPVEVSMARVKARGGWDDRYQLKAKPFHVKLRKIFRQLASKYPKRIKIVDASQSTDIVAQNIQEIVIQHFGLKHVHARRR